MRLQLDLRVVAATNKDLSAMLQDGRLREDLYYRLAVIPIRVASLRERSEDIMPIAEHSRRETAARLGRDIEGFDETVVHWMEHHAWPGNVRELVCVGPLKVKDTVATTRLDTILGLSAISGRAGSRHQRR